MNKTDRLLAIVLKLQSLGNATAKELADSFETSVRTIYRDIQALSEAGVPIIATPGQGYALVEGYFLPPLSFSTEEAVMLLLGGQYVAQNFDANYQSAANSASLKIEGVLPEAVRQEVRQLQEGIRLVAVPGDNPALQKELRRAVVERKTVQFRYYTRYTQDDSEPITERRADPYGLVFVNGAWYMTAYCHLRHAVRTFRLDRIENLALLNQNFERPTGFKLEQTQRRQDRNVTVRVLFDKSVSRWVQESENFYVVEQTETPDGLLVTLQVRQEQEVLNWLLSWGSHVQVLEPASLRRLIIEEMQQVLQNYEKGAALLT